MKSFEKAGTLRKKETEKALNDREWIKQKMREAHSNGNRDKNNGTRQIRVMGKVDFVLEKVKELKEKYGLQYKHIGIYKNEKDKDDRKGDYSAKYLRAYINVPEYAIN